MYIRCCEWCGLDLQLTHDMCQLGYSCPRCGHDYIYEPRKMQNQKGLASSLAGLVVLYPAITQPIFKVELVGISNQASVLDCINALLLDGSLWLIFIVIMMMVITPFFLLFATFMIHLEISVNRKLGKIGCAWLKVFNASREWGMFDVFILALIVAYVKTGDFGEMIIMPGTVFVIFVFVCCLLSQLYTPEKYLWKMADE